MKIFLLKFLLKKYKPQLVVVFGVYGREDAREAINTTLSKHTPTLSASDADFFNTLARKFGVLGILYAIVRKRPFPHVLIVDTADGNQAYLKLKTILPIKLAVVMPVGDIPSTAEAVFAGPRTALRGVVSDIEHASHILLTHDDETVREIADKEKTKCKTFGFDEHADIRIVSAEPTLTIHLDGVEGSTLLDFKCGTVFQKAVLKNAFGKRNVYAVAAAIGAALQFRIEHNIAVQDLITYIPPKNSLKLTEGVKRTALFSHIGNVSPHSAREALELLGRMRKDKRVQRAVVVMGDIITHQDAEYFEGLHRTLGELAVKNADALFLAGERVVFTEDEAYKFGMSRDNVRRFDDIADAARAAQDFIDTGDAVLILGSSEVHLERAIEELLQYTG